MCRKSKSRGDNPLRLHSLLYYYTAYLLVYQSSRKLISYRWQNKYASSIRPPPFDQKSRKNQNTSHVILRGDKDNKYDYSQCVQVEVVLTEVARMSLLKDFLLRKYVLPLGGEVNGNYVTELRCVCDQRSTFH